MTEADWLTATDPRPLLEFLRGKASDRKLRLFAVACCRRVLTAFTADACRAAIEASEQYADGLISEERFDLLSIAAEEAWKDTVLEPRGEGDYNARAASYASSPSLHAVLIAVTFAAQAGHVSMQREQVEQSILLRDIFGNPFRPVVFDPAWRSETVVALASALYADRAFDRLPILADALEEVGCDQPNILNHCRGPGPHVRGCWAVDLVLGKE
jgi:hypothetical protein